MGGVLERVVCVQRVGGDGGFAGTIAGERLLSKNSSVFVFHVCLVLHA